MTEMKRWLLAITLACGALPAAVQAQGPCGGWGFGWVDGYGQGRVVNYNANIPYFSAHPPVYYSHEIARRPMGPSPFAYPGYCGPGQADAPVMAALAATPQRTVPVMIENSYFAGKGSTSRSRVVQASYVRRSESREVALGSKFIVNPYVTK